MREAVVIGAGLHRYGVFPDKSIFDLGVEAIQNALQDANMNWEDIETAYCGTTQTKWSTGHNICQKMGLTGLGIMNIENASASGSSAFREAFLAVSSGAHDIAMAFGVDKIKMREKSKSDTKKEVKIGETVIPSPVEIFGSLAKQHMKEYGTTIDQLAKIAVKNRYHASLNPFAQFQQAVTLEEVHNAPLISEPLTKLHCCPWGDGAAAAIVCAKDVAKKYTNKVCPIISASVIKSLHPQGDPFLSLTEQPARLAYEAAGIDPRDLDLIELHDAFTIEEIIYTEALGLCEKGQGGLLAEAGTTSLSGTHVINSSGGLLGMGHPLGPTGVGQIAEILWQMRGECGKRQIKKSVNLALAHMIGAGGVGVVHVLKK